MPKQNTTSNNDNSEAKLNDNVINIKKYANRRLYNMQTSQYITLEDVKQMIIDDNPIMVIDAKNGNDITRSVMVQIILEQESQEENNLIPIEFMKSLIRYYDQNITEQSVNYLQKSMEHFSDYMQQGFAGFEKQLNNMGQFQDQFSAIEQLAQKNMEIFQNSLTAFWSGYPMGSGSSNNDKNNK